MAGLGIKNFTAEVATSADVDGYLMQQSIPVFASTSARDAAYTAESVTPAQGMYCVTTDTDTRWYYDGSAWEADLEAGPTSETPSWNNLSVGAGVQVADIQVIGYKQIRYKGQITLASDSSITGNITLDIPNSLTSVGTPCRGVAIYNDTGTRLYLGSVGITPSSTVIAFTHGESTNGGSVNSTAPFTFGDTDVIGWDITIGVA